MGITDDILRKSGHFPSKKDMLNIFESGNDIDFLIDLSSSWIMLFGPVLLLVSWVEIISSISSGVVALIINEKGFGFFRYFLKDVLPPYFHFFKIFSATVV